LRAAIAVRNRGWFLSRMCGNHPDALLTSFGRAAPLLTKEGSCFLKTPAS